MSLARTLTTKLLRMLLLDHLTKHFEMLWLINEED